MVAFFAIATSALLTLPLVLAEAVSTPSSLYARQISGFDPSTLPTTCLQDKCKAFVDSVTATNCVSLDCLCTSTVANAMKTCLQCAVDAHVASFNQTTLDDAIKGFTDGCSAAGHPVSGITSGGGSGSASSASSPSGTTAGAATTTAKGSGAVAQMTVSILGAVFAVAVGGAAFA